MRRASLGEVLSKAHGLAVGFVLDRAMQKHDRQMCFGEWKNRSSYKITPPWLPMFPSMMV
jgi:hypothetical protein